MSIALYWLLFLVAAVALFSAPVVARWEQRRDDKRDLDRRARRERTEQARRRIRLGL